MLRELIGLSYSPWTEKARWALDHHRLEYRYTEHFLMFGMPALWLKVRKPWGELTVPALVDGKVRLVDSMKIARHADGIGKGERLFPEEHLAEIERWNALSERVCDAGRALGTEHIAADPDAQLEAVPKVVPGPLRGPTSRLTGVVLAYLDHEFGVRAPGHPARVATIREVLGAMPRSGLYLVANRFTFADVAMAVALQVVKPVSQEYLPLGPATRRAWTQDELSRDFAALLDWRDRLYFEHRRPR